MGQLSIDTDQAKAANFLARINRAIIATAAARRQGHDDRLHAPSGARAPAALGRAPVELRTITEPSAMGKAERITPLGYKTAVRAMPRILAALGDADPRKRAAVMLADAMEKIGSIKGGDLGGTDTKAGTSDGGATTKVKHASRLRSIAALANGWQQDARRGALVDGERVLMPIARKRGDRQEIKAWPALVAVCVDGLALDDVLRGHGWSAQNKNRQKLGDAILATLDDVADGLGLGRWDEKRC